MNTMGCLMQIGCVNQPPDTHWIGLGKSRSLVRPVQSKVRSNPTFSGQIRPSPRSFSPGEMETILKPVLQMNCTNKVQELPPESDSLRNPPFGCFFSANDVFWTLAQTSFGKP